MSNFPLSWASVTLADAVEPSAPIIYGILQPGPNVSDGVPYVRPTEISEDGIELAALRRTSKQIAQKYERATLAPNDVVLSIVGTIGKVAVVPTILAGANITQSSCRLRVDCQLIGCDFLAWYLRSPSATTEFDKYKLGTAVPRLNLQDVRKIALPLPPAPEQRRIVAKIDRLSARSKRARDKLDTVYRLARRSKAAILDAVFSGGLISDGQGMATPWPVVAAGSLIKRFQAGKNLRCEERPPRLDERGVVKVSAVTWGTFDPLKSKTLPSDYTPLDRDKIDAGDFLFSRANTLELVGACVIVQQAPPNLYLSDKVLRLEMDEDVKPWLLWFLRSNQGRRSLEAASSGNQLSMRNISQDGLKTIRVPFPDFETRQEIVRRIEHAFPAIDRLAAEAQSARALLDRLDQSILAKAFRGELVPQDPNDEPASVLLGRVHATRKSTEKTMDRRRRSQSAK